MFALLGIKNRFLPFLRASNMPAGIEDVLDVVLEGVVVVVEATGVAGVTVVVGVT